MRRLRVFALGAVLALAAACAPKPAPLPPPPPPLVVPPPVVVIPPRPQSPGFAADTQQLPPIGADGQYVTINSGVSGERAFWHVRTALNVAAVGCRGTVEVPLVAAYNRFVANHSAAIRAAERAVIADLAKSSRTNGIAARDALSTRLFNYFAQPTAGPAFCAAALPMAEEIAAGPAATQFAEARRRLDVMDQPFRDFYAAFARYQRDAAAWDLAYAPPPTAVTVAVQPPVTGPS